MSRSHRCSCAARSTLVSTYWWRAVVSLKPPLWRVPMHQGGVFRYSWRCWAECGGDSQVARLVELWRTDLGAINKPAANAIGNPEQHPELFPDLNTVRRRHCHLCHCRHLLVRSVWRRSVIWSTKWVRSCRLAPTRPWRNIGSAISSPVNRVDPVHNCF